MKRWNDHLEAVGETYLQHLHRAARFAATMLVGGLACLVHALLPFFFVRTGSDCIRRLHHLVESRVRAEPPVDEQSVR